VEDFCESSYVTFIQTIIIC